MAWCGDVRFKLRGVIKFLVVGKESTNIQKRFEMYTLSLLLINALLVVWLRGLQVLRKAKRSSVAGQYSSQSGVASVTEGLRPECVQLSSVSKKSVNRLIDVLEYSNVCIRWVARSLTDRHKVCGGRCVEICSADTRLIVTHFTRGSSLCIQHASTTSNRRQEEVQWNGIIHIIGGRSLVLALQRGKSWSLFFFFGGGGHAEGPIKYT
jgi:hypothetical protein